MRLVVSEVIVTVPAAPESGVVKVVELEFATIRAVAEPPGVVPVLTPRGNVPVPGMNESERIKER
jgi:hypothetical protein